MTLDARLVAASAPTSPAVAWLVVTVVLYAAIALPVLWWGLGRLGRRTSAWLAIPILSAVASVTLWVLARPPA